MKNKVFLLIKQMSGGGAERVVSLLASELSKREYSATVILTHQSMADADLSRLSDSVKVVSIDDELKKGIVANSDVNTAAIRIIAKFERIFFPNGKARQLVKMYKVRNYAKYMWLKRYCFEHKCSTLIAFQYESIFLTLLSSVKTQRVIISDRGDPGQSVSSRTDMAFFDLMFKKADHMVFQSPDVKQWYKDRFGLDGTIIFNPIKPDLPEKFYGERKKRIVNFCRISPPKRLDLLISAFDRFANTHNDFSLYIYGDQDIAAFDYYGFIKDKIQQAYNKDLIFLLPAKKRIHEEIIDYSLFVSSSEHEGMSNSMLEAMAIGLPTICTDCPAGGARAVIKDHENGILTPVGDVEALCKAMCEVADNPDLAQKLSENGIKVRETQSVEKIINQWMELIND